MSQKLPPEGSRCVLQKDQCFRLEEAEEWTATYSPRFQTEAGAGGGPAAGACPLKLWGKQTASSQVFVFFFLKWF